VITNPAYIGIGYLGAGRGGKRGTFEMAENIRKAGACPPIIDAETFERAQAIRAQRARLKRQPVKGSGALSGTIVCAHCGRRMSATVRKGRIAYVCNTPNETRKTSCQHWRVYEDDLLPEICAKLVQTVDGELVKALAVKPPVAERLSDLDMVRQQIAGLEK